MIGFLIRLVELLSEGFVHALAVAFIFAWLVSDRLEGGLWLAIAMLRAFLAALVDPMDPGLDYLRQDPAAAVAAREGGEA